MPQARVTQARNALAAFIDAAWTAAYPGRAADDEVIARYRVDFSLEPDRPADYPTGRKVCVFVGPYQGVPATRGDDADDYTLTVWVVEHYRGPGDPPEDWLDARLHFVDWLYRTVTNAREVLLLDSLWPQEAGEVIPLDPQRLAEFKQFWSSFPVTYREHAAP